MVFNLQSRMGRLVLRAEILLPFRLVCTVLEPEAQINTKNALLFYSNSCSGICTAFSKNIAMGAKERMINNPAVDGLLLHQHVYNQ